MQTFRIANLEIKAVKESADKICYVLYPLENLGEWIEEAAQRFGVTIVVVTGMDWDDDLTPWPAAGQPPGSFPHSSPTYCLRLNNGLGCPKMPSEL